MINQIILLIFLSVSAGALRQLAPYGIKWTGHWPTTGTSAEEAYKMIAQEGDPAFLPFDEVLAIHKKNEATFIDARASDEYKQGHIPRARSLPYYEIGQYKDSALKGLTVESPLVIYCEGIGCELSFFLGRELKSGGFTNIRLFYGGIPEWTNAGYPIEK